MRALVTGGAGFIGSHLAERLHSQGHTVLVVDNLASGTSRLPILQDLGVDVDTTDIRQEKLRSVISSFAPQLIFHLAAQPNVNRSVADPLHDAKVNVVGTLRVLETARELGARVVFASSGGTIYGQVEATQLPISEDTEGRPTSPYGITKKVAEDYFRFYRGTYALPFVSLALSNVYGPRQDPHGEAGVVAIFAFRLLKGERCVIFGDGKQTRDFVYVGDVVDAFLAAAERGGGETINVGTGVETSVEELYRAMAAVCRVDEKPAYEPERPGEVRRSSLDISKAKRLLGWEPVTSLPEGLTRTIDSFRPL
jgi:UDP-glucose 4-epimerase